MCSTIKCSRVKMNNSCFSVFCNKQSHLLLLFVLSYVALVKCLEDPHKEVVEVAKVSPVAQNKRNNHKGLKSRPLSTHTINEPKKSLVVRHVEDQGPQIEEIRTLNKNAIIIITKGTYIHHSPFPTLQYMPKLA